MPKRNDIQSILIIGAGPIVIGQACEFDYSGAQACKALREEGYKPRYMHINGRWADHVGFAVDQEDLARMRGGSLVEDRVRRGRKH